MKRNIKVEVDGVLRSVTYSKNGNTYELETDDELISKNAMLKFSIHNGKAMFLKLTPRTGEIMDRIINAIRQNEGIASN